MLEQLLSGLKNDALGAINDNQEIPNDKLDSILNIIGDATKKEVKKESSASGIENVMNLFSDNENNSSANSIQGNITNSVIENLMGKAGLNKSGAQSAVTALLPIVLNQITSKNNKTASNDSSPLLELFGSALAGNSKGGLLGKLGGLFK